MRRVLIGLVMWVQVVKELHYQLRKRRNRK